MIIRKDNLYVKAKQSRKTCRIFLTISKHLHFYFLVKTIEKTVDKTFAKSLTMNDWNFDVSIFEKRMSFISERYQLLNHIQPIITCMTTQYCIDLFWKCLCSSSDVIVKNNRSIYISSVPKFTTSNTYQNQTIATPVILSYLDLTLNSQPYWTHIITHADTSRKN